MSVFRLPTRRVSVVLAMRGLPSRSVGLFLHARHGRLERPSELLAEPKPFLPIADSDDPSEIVLVRKGAIAMISVPAALESDPVHDRREAVQVILEDGSQVDGEVCFAMPKGHGRLQDFMNSDEAFVRVAEGHTVHLVNKALIRSVSVAPRQAQTISTVAPRSRANSHVHVRVPASPPVPRQAASAATRVIRDTPGYEWWTGTTKE